MNNHSFFTFCFWLSAAMVPLGFWQVLLWGVDAVLLR